MTDPRVERNRLSVVALHELLRDVAFSPQSFLASQLLVSSLASQGALSRYEDDNRGIAKSSLNTIKRISNEYLDGGFDALDRMRKAARQSVSRARNELTRPRRNTKDQLLARIVELEAEVLHASQDLLLLTHALERSLAQGRAYAHETKLNWLIERCRKEQRELRDGLSLMQSEVRIQPPVLLKSV